jgi:SpoVK/Ycf46/Vps4 family AAA+-type ATPase
MVVIEDVDLIARDRSQLGPCEEPLLNKLLNEMDGLKEDADILFVLTTNRPEQLESALTGRPGRIDQAIEVPLPDEAGRRKLVQLYGKELPLDAAVIAEAVQRTEGASAAFIKELMRRIAQPASSAPAARRSKQAISAKRLTICCLPAAGSMSDCWAERSRWPGPAARRWRGHACPLKSHATVSPGSGKRRPRRAVICRPIRSIMRRPGAASCNGGPP